MRDRSLGLGLLVGVLALGVLPAGTGAQEEPAVAGSDDADVYGSWMSRPPAQWPKLAVVNRIEYQDQQFPVAGCGFLLAVGDEVLAATAKHVLTYFKSGKMDSVDFQGTLKSWHMFPKDAPSEVVVVGALINRDPDEALQKIPCDRDWVLFHVTERSKKIQPLRLRTTPLVKDEPVFVVGWRYTEEDCPQVVYPGRYVRSERDAVCITAPMLIDNKVPGLSGAPVIDTRGYVIGIMSRGKGEIQRLSPVAYAQEVLRSRDAGESAQLPGFGPDPGERLRVGSRCCLRGAASGDRRPECAPRLTGVGNRSR